MTALIFAISILLTSTGAYISFNKGFGNIALILIPFIGLVNNFLWAYLSRITSNSYLLTKYGFYWDNATTLLYVLIPIVFFDVKPSITMYIGLFFTFLGIFLIKLG